MTRSGTIGSLTVLAAGGLLLIVAIPFVFIVLQAIFPYLGRGSFATPLAHIATTLGDSALLRMSSNTVLLGIFVVTISVIIATPLAVFRALYQLPHSALWDVLLLIPFMIPPYISTLGWIMTLQPRGYLEQFLGVNLASFLFSISGMAFIMSLNTFPLIYFSVSRTIEAIGGRYSDVGRVFGASPWRAFWRITLPLSTPGLVAGMLLVFSAAIEEYGTPAALGARSGFQVLVTGIDNRVSDWPIDLPGAATLSLLLVLMSLSAFLLQRWLLTRHSYQTTGGKPQAIEKQPLGRMRLPVIALFILVVFIASGAPLLAILATALSRTISGGLNLSNLGLDNFFAILDDTSGAFNALCNSLVLGVAAAVIAGFLGATASYAIVKKRFRGRIFLDTMTTLPNALPGIVVAVGLILAWNLPGLPITPYNTPFILLLAYCCILLPQPVRYTTAAFHQIGDNLEAAARIAGAGNLSIFRRIMLPLITPSLLASMLLVFAVASRELVASIVVAPVGMQTISTFIWKQFEQGSVGLGMAMAITAIVITTIIPFSFLALLRRSNLTL